MSVLNVCSLDSKLNACVQFSGCWTCQWYVIAEPNDVDLLPSHSGKNCVIPNGLSSAFSSKNATSSPGARTDASTLPVAWSRCACHNHHCCFFEWTKLHISSSSADSTGPRLTIICSEYAACRNCSFACCNWGSFFKTAVTVLRLIFSTLALISHPTTINCHICNFLFHFAPVGPIAVVLNESATTTIFIPTKILGQNPNSGTTRESGSPHWNWDSSWTVALW